MKSLWRAVSVLVDEAVLGARSVLRPPALAGDAGLAPPCFEALAAEQAARPPEAILPARLERRPGQAARIVLRFPALETESFADLHAADGAPTARLSHLSGAPASESSRLRLAHAPPDTLVVYHHGLAEFPHDASAKRILSRADTGGRFDWACMQAPLHTDQASVGRRLLASQASFGRCLMGSVFAVRALAVSLRARFGYRRLALAGMSMGGVVTLLDAALPGSPFALHMPLQAGPDLADALLRSSFARLVSKKTVRTTTTSPDVSRLDVARLLAGPGTPIRAVLSDHDRLFRIEAQRAAYARVERAEVVEIAAGHITGALRFGTLAGLVRAALERELWGEAAVPASPAARPAGLPSRNADVREPHGVAAVA